MRIPKLKPIVEEIISESEMAITSAGIPSHAMGNPNNRVQTALYILGVDPLKIYGKAHKKKGVNYNPDRTIKGQIWNRSDEYLWELLEMARNNYNSLIKKYHPDIAGPEYQEKASQLNTAWELVQNAFKRKGYELAEQEN